LSGGADVRTFRRGYFDDPKQQTMENDMTTAIQPQDMNGDTMLAVVAGGDCSRLSPEQKLAYYHARCEAAGLDPRAQPFAFMRLQNNKEVLYALKSCSDQLAAKNGVICQILSQVTEEGMRIVTITATTKDGRKTDEIGAVSVKGLSGDALCNAYMKAVTKAKRRATLSICGLGMLDETEVETISHDRYGVSAEVDQSRSQAAPPEHAAENRIRKLWNEAVARLGRTTAEARWLEGTKGYVKDRSQWTDEHLVRLATVLFPEEAAEKEPPLGPPSDREPGSDDD
jgi:hypothetical protein